MRKQPDGRQRPHLGRIGAEGQDRDERQPELGDLVAEDRDGLAEPEPPEIGCVEEERRDEAADAARAAGSPGVRPGCAGTADQAGGFFCCSASCLWTSWSISAWRFCPNAPDHDSPKSHGQRRATTSPMRAASAQLGFGRRPEAGDPVHQEERQHPKDDPGDPSNHSRTLRPSGAPHVWRGARRPEPRRHRDRPSQSASPRRSAGSHDGTRSAPSSAARVSSRP